jgi:hypothetical protein
MVISIIVVASLPLLSSTVFNSRPKKSPCQINKPCFFPFLTGKTCVQEFFNWIITGYPLCQVD